MSNYSTYGDLGETVGTYAVAKLLKTADTKLVLDKFAMSEPLPANRGDTVKWRRIRPFPVNTTQLTEGVDLDVELRGSWRDVQHLVQGCGLVG